MEAAFKKIEQLLTNDDFQIRALGPQLYSEFSSMSGIDQHRNAEGEFGKSFKNPIPTNGPIGSISYLSNLSVEKGHRITFHRVNTIQKIDAYEYVSLSGSEWGFLFLDMYHSRKSRKIPDGFIKQDGPHQFIGFNHFWDDFPFGFAEQKSKVPSDLRLLYSSIDSISREMSGRNYVRPEVHNIILQQLIST